MEEGSRLHKEYQQSLIEKYINSDVIYRKELKVKEEVEYKNITYIINGRVDSFIEYKNKIIIEEIKSVGTLSENLSIDNNMAYYAQLLIYAYFLTKDIDDNIEIEVMLTYISRFDESIKKHSKKMSKNEIYNFFMDTLEKYYKFSKAYIDNEEELILTGKNVPFPYANYRQSQKQFMTAVYSCITNKNKLFAQAPTGVGKTLSTLYPSIKALSNKLGKKIFYITAKTITKNVCIDNLYMLNQLGFKGISLNITSKENICANDEINCNSQFCTLAKGHFDRLNEAILDIITNEKIINDNVIKDYSEKHNVCPYSFQLELIDFAHIIVCDYNYVYDPQVAFTKYFDKEKNDFIILVDEAHNLEDRSRDFFSADLTFSQLTFLYNNISTERIKSYIKEVLKQFKSFFESDNSFSLKDIPKAFINSLFDLRYILDEYFAENEIDTAIKDKLLESYFAIDYFIKTSIYYDNKYETLFEINKFDKTMTLFCIDTSTRFFKINTLCRCTIFFSATLTPINYFAELFGGDKEDYFISLNTSFNINNQLTLIDSSISTYYKDRDNSYEKIAQSINHFISAKNGNYFIFFPSYIFLNKVLDLFKTKNKDVNIKVQTQNMNTQKREQFLESFNKQFDLNTNENISAQSSNNTTVTTVAFLVIGGTFSEGVNLVGDKLIGVCVIGVGISMLNFKSDIVKKYYDNYNNKGYEFAYMYQGFNKILQSAGRVIRSETDKGVILLIDTRYSRQDYKMLFPHNYKNTIYIKNNIDLDEKLAHFWE